jgi:hypothetical protein
MAMREDFCAFILTHGRPDRVHTYNTLMKAGYTGKVFIVIDDEDKAADEYRKRFGDKVLQFCKSEWAAKTDEGDNFQHRKAIVYARNACWDLARQVGCRYFVQFDDDYKDFNIRYDSSLHYVSGSVHKTIDGILLACLEFFKNIPAEAVAMSQGGDHIGGGGVIRADKQIGGWDGPSLRRKCMNSWFCDTKKQFQFFGHMNEDVSAYVVYGLRGKLFLTVMQAMLTQLPTQVTAGGMSDLYLESGTYVKSFYTVMAAPSCTKVGTMGDPRSIAGNYRIHHKINWHNCAPKILREQTRKPR